MAKKAPPIQDRRGFEPIYAICASQILLGVGGCLLQQSSSWWHVVVIALGGIGWYVMDRTTAPPWNDPARYYAASLQSRKEQEEQEKVPVLICAGDSLTQGRCSANFVDSILPKLSKRNSNQPSSSSPLLHVVNAGQNNICTWPVLQNKISSTILPCQPNYIFILLGTNDINAIYRPNTIGRAMTFMWGLPKHSLSMDAYKQNMTNILHSLINQQEVQPNLKIALSTLPPLGEDLDHPANQQFVEKANHILRCIVQEFQTAAEEERPNIVLLDVHSEMKKQIRTLRQKQQDPTASSSKTTTNHPYFHSVDDFIYASAWMSFFHHVLGISWTTLSHWIGNTIMSDSLHLNEIGADIIANHIVNWLQDDICESSTNPIQSKNKEKKMKLI